MIPPATANDIRLPIYLDNNATTRPDPLVVEAMINAFQFTYGNPSSAVHEHGRLAREAVELSKTLIASLAGCDPSEITFTSGATESINMVLKGISRQTPLATLKVLTAVTEHTAVLDNCRVLEALGATVIRLPVLPDGHVNLSEFQEALVIHTPDLVTLMHANNEIGTVHPITEISGLCKQHKTLLHVDAAQSFGKIPTEFHNGNIDFMSISGHKCYGPKGIGCLIVRRRNPPLRLTPLIHGGGQQKGLRSGTLNVAAIVGLGKAAEICSTNMPDESLRLTALADQLIATLIKNIPTALINGPILHRLPGNVNISFPGIQAQHLLPALKSHISVSSGSACASGHSSPSYVLKAIGRSDDDAAASLRIGIGRFNTTDEIRITADIITQTVRALSPI